MGAPLFTKRFWLDALERAVKTAAQAVLALITTDMTGITDLDLQQSASVAGLAVLVSVLTSLVSMGSKKGDNASIVVKDKLVDTQYPLLRETGNGTTVENEDALLSDDPDLVYTEDDGIYR